MSDHQITAAFYLSPTLDAWWRWSDDGQVLTLADDATIAFLPEVEAVLKRLAPQGLPPFGGVALLLAACREGWPQSSARLRLSNERESLNNSITLGINPRIGPIYHKMVNELDSLLSGLDALHRLPANQRQGLEAKALLAEVVYDGASSRSSAEQAQDVVRALDEGINPQTLRARLAHEPKSIQFAHEVDGLAKGLARLDPQLLEQRGKTGLDEQVQKPHEDLSVPQRVRQLLAELKNDSELAGLSKLARDLMAAVTIPRTLRAREEMAVGGVSDLTNRGPLDRLIVSELAHDDLTLAVRVAVNEALYLRREMPPREPPHRRAILIDAGIRMWGVPRVFAAAAALALAATNDSKAELSAFRATKEGVAPIDLTTRSGLDDHLSALEPAPHPAAALQPFFDALHEREDLQSDAVLITHADVLADAEFLTALAKLEEPAMYIAAVDRDGAFRLWSFTRAGKKLVREAKLSLDELLESPKPQRKAAGVALVNKAIDMSLPAILYANPFPFYLPYRANPKRSAVSSACGLVAAADDGRLLHWHDPKRGARQLTTLLPAGLLQVLYIDDPTAAAIAVVLNKGTKQGQVLIADLPSSKCVMVALELREANPKAMFQRAGIVYALYDHRLDAFEPFAGKYLASAPLQPHSLRGKFLFRERKYWIPSFDGSVIKLDEVAPGRRALFYFEREGYEEPCAVLPGARVSDGKNTKQIPTDARGLEPIRVSPDGHRLIFQLRHLHPMEYLHIDLNNGSERRSRLLIEDFLSDQMRWSTSAPVTVRKRFGGVFLDKEGRLALRSPGGIFTFDFLGDELVLLETSRRFGPIGPVRNFGRVRANVGGRLRLSVATWSDGSRAFLDSRGMLHLKGDRSMPELSFALTNPLALAAWSSEGKVWGPKYLVGDAEQAPASYFAELLRKFVARLR